MPDVFVSPDSRNQKHDDRSQHQIITPSEKPPPKSMGAFDNFCEYPEGVTFEHQEKDEKIILFTRRHHITNVIWVAMTAVLLLLPLLTPLLLTTFEGVTISVSPRMLFVLISFYYLVVFAYALINFATWFYNVGIVTQKHVVDIDFSDITYKNVATTKVGMIQDVNFTQGGFLRSHFNYGDVFIQTAGNSQNFEFLRIPNPGKAVYMIQKLIGVV